MNDSLEWTTEDGLKALGEGWNCWFVAPSSLRRIEMYDDGTPFKSDEEAVEFVKRGTEPHHKKAALIHAHYLMTKG